METTTQIDYRLIDAFVRGLKPDPLMTVSEWADANRVLSGEESARPGPFETKLTPYMFEIGQRLSTLDPAQKIVFKKSSQVAATEMGNNWLGYIIDLIGGTFMYIMPTVDLMKKTSKTRIQKMIDNTESLRHKVYPSRSKDGGSTILEKFFEGGQMVGVGANSPVGVSSTPCPYAYADEIDRYPENIAGEGSVLSLIRTRQITFGDNKKMFLTSTPTLKNRSLIDSEFESTSQRYFHVPCPICNHEQVLFFDHVVYLAENGEWLPIRGSSLTVNSPALKDVRYKCVNCNTAIEHRHKRYMLDNGFWKPKYPEREDGITYGYFINALYSPPGMYSWREMAIDYIEAQNDESKMIAFINTKEGECYEGERGDVPDWESLYNRAHNEKLSYERNKPFKETVFITAGVDVQKDRLEVMIVGWAKGKISQQIDYRVLVGDTDKPAVWAELGKIVNETWEREDGMIIPLKIMAIDTGYNTKYVYDFVDKWPINKVLAVKGMDRLDTIYGAPKQIQFTRSGKKMGKVKVWGVGVSIIKGELYGNLKREIDKDTGEVPNGYCHLLTMNNTSFYRGLTAEELMAVKNKKNFTEFVWHKKYERNEPLDTMVYARMAASVNGMDHWSDERWNEEYAAGAVAKEEVQLLTEEKPIEKIKSPYWK